MPAQTCPVCLSAMDVSIYVTGQKVRCKRCGNKIIVERSDAAPGAAAAVPPRRGTPAAGSPSVPPETRADRPRAATPMHGMPPVAAPFSPAAPMAAAAPARPLPQPAPAPAAPAAPAPAAPAAARAAEPPPAGVGPAADSTDKPVVPGYTMLKKMGEGAMGAVWKALHDPTGEVVAMKFLVGHLAKHKDFIQRFEREAKAMEVSESPYVVRLRGRGEHQGLHYIVMEFIDGYPLRNEMASLSRNSARAVGICRRITRGLKAMHEKGVRHRDLKPENVLMGNQGEVKIVDFGLAGMAADMDPYKDLTREGVTMGTMNYMAPEQKINAKRVDTRADIYSLGVILFEMLTGELPTGVFRFPHERGAQVPAFTDVVLRRALAHEAADRHATADELDTDLKQLEHLIRNPGAEDDSQRRRWWPFA